MNLTIYFDGSFWCGLVEYQEQGKMQVLRHIFGPEPKDSEVLAFVNTSLLSELAQVPFVTIDTEKVAVRRINPKRMQRLVNKEKIKPVFSTKAQEAFKKAQEIKKQERRSTSKANKKADQNLRFQMKQYKKLQKKKGR